MNNRDLNTLILCAFRYAIGRNTAIPWEVIRIILKQKNELEPHVSKLIAKEIRYQYTIEPKSMELNDKDWLHLLRTLESHESGNPQI